MRVSILRRLISDVFSLAFPAPLAAWILIDLIKNQLRFSLLLCLHIVSSYGLHNSSVEHSGKGTTCQTSLFSLVTSQTVFERRRSTSTRLVGFVKSLSNQSIAFAYVMSQVLNLYLFNFLRAYVLSSCFPFC